MAIAVASIAGNTWNTTTTPLTASITVAIGDFLVILCSNHSSASTFAASGGTSVTYTAQTSANSNASCPSTAIITAPITSAQTYTLSIARAGNTFAWGFVCLRLTGVSSVGAKTSAQDAVTGTEQTSITTTGAGSAIAVMLNDKGSSGTAGVWVTSGAGTFTPEGTTSTQGNYSGIYLSAGAAGAKTIGVSTPSGFASSISAIELIPTVTATAANPLGPRTLLQAVKRASFY